jgi:WD40 domain-containing protein
VLCSPNAAKSRWVNKEIEDFRAMGQGERILALIIAGEPNSSNPELECFPPALRYPNDPIAGDLRPTGDGRSKGFLKILAGLAQLNFDMLFRRDRKRRRRQHILGALAAITSGAVLAVAGNYTLQAHARVSEASRKESEATRQTSEAAANAANQTELATAERAKAQQQKQERERQEAIAKSMTHEAERQQAMNQEQAIATRRDQARQILLLKARRAADEGQFPLNALYFGIAMGFRGFGYEELSAADKAKVDATYPPFFDPAKDPDLKTDFMRVIRNEKRTLLPVWSATHDAGVHCVSYSPDGRMVATGGHDHQVHLIDPASGKVLKVLEGHANDVICLAFSPDMKLLASGSWDATIRLWDLPSRTMKNTLSGHRRGVSGLAFSPDSLTLASVGRDSSLRLWGKGQRVIQSESQPNRTQSDMYGLALGPQGRFLATVSNQDPVCLWDWTSGRAKVLLTSANSSNATSYCVAFSPDGRQLASGGREGMAREGIIRSGMSRRQPPPGCSASIRASCAASHIAQMAPCSP